MQKNCCINSFGKESKKIFVNLLFKWKVFVGPKDYPTGRRGQ